MTLEEAMSQLKEKYEQVRSNPQIDDPVSWALYRTWCISKRKKKSGRPGGLYQGCKWCVDRHVGKWIRIGYDIYECSECHQYVKTSDIDAYDWCHHCGAKLERRTDE